VAGRRDALADRLFQSLIGSMELASIWAGLRLDLYEVLRRHGPVTVDELAELASIDARYAREWLEQQAVAGLLDVEDAGQDAASRRYRLPDAHADVLLDADHPAHAGATAWWIGSLAEVLQRIPAVYRSGAGLPYPEYGADCRLAIANFNRPMFVNDLAGWFAAAPEVEARLTAEGARALDVGCGIGWSSISLAKAFPSLRVDGIDSDVIVTRVNSSWSGGLPDEEVSLGFNRICWEYRRGPGRARSASASTSAAELVEAPEDVVDG